MATNADLYHGSSRYDDTGIVAINICVMVRLSKTGVQVPLPEGGRSCRVDDEP
jgi:hypothetical protein